MAVTCGLQLAAGEQMEAIWARQRLIWLLYLHLLVSWAHGSRRCSLRMLWPMTVKGQQLVRQAWALQSQTR